MVVLRVWPWERSYEETVFIIIIIWIPHRIAMHTRGGTIIIIIPRDSTNVECVVRERYRSIIYFHMITVDINFATYFFVYVFGTNRVRCDSDSVCICICIYVYVYVLCRYCFARCRAAATAMFSNTIALFSKSSVDSKSLPCCRHCYCCCCYYYCITRRYWCCWCWATACMRRMILLRSNVGSGESTKWSSVSYCSINRACKSRNRNSFCRCMCSSVVEFSV